MSGDSYRVKPRSIVGKEISTGELEALIGLLKDRREKVRVFAAYYLIELGKPAGLEAIVQAVANGQLPNCPELSFILTVIACESPDLVLSLLAHVDKGVQLNALTALVDTGRREAGRHLIPLLSSQDPDLRAFAAEGLGRLRYGEAKAALRRLLEDENWRVRGNAARALRGLRMNRAADPGRRRKPLSGRTELTAGNPPVV